MITIKDLLKKTDTETAEQRLNSMMETVQVEKLNELRGDGPVLSGHQTLADSLALADSRIIALTEQVRTLYDEKHAAADVAAAELVLFKSKLDVLIAAHLESSETSDVDLLKKVGLWSADDDDLNRRNLGRFHKIGVRRLGAQRVVGYEQALAFRESERVKTA